MRNTNKKGFTIVELVIVVAVIAILAAVLIPTFSGVIAKAKLSADKKAVQEMNTYIAMEEADTFEKALAALKEHGINAENIVPLSADKIFAWNKDTNKIEIADATATDKKPLVDSIKEEVAANVKTTEALELAAYFGSNEIKLETDLTVTYTINVPSNSNITIDLNGKTLTTSERDTNGSHHYAFNVHGTVALENGTVNARGIQLYAGGKLVVGDGVTVNAVDNNGGACFWIYGGELEINGGTFNALNGDQTTDYTYEPGIINNNGGKVTINKGTFTAESSCYAITNNSGEMIINGGTFSASRGVISANDGSVTIKGGKFTVTGQEALPAHVVYTCDATVTINAGEFTNNGAGDVYTYCVQGLTDKITEVLGSITLPDGTKLTVGQTK